MIKKEDMEKIASLPTQELIAFAIAQAQLNESLERENQCLKKTMEHREVINRNLIDMQRQLDKSHADIQRLQMLVGYLCKKSGMTRLGITEEDFRQTCDGHRVGIRDSENFGGDKIIEIIVKWERSKEMKEETK